MSITRKGRTINWGAFRSGLLLGVAIASACAAAVLYMGGCESQVRSPRTGEPVSIEQAQLDLNQIEAEKKAEAQAEDAAFRRQVDRIQRQAKRDIAALNSECHEKAQQLQDNLDQALADLEAAHNASAIARDSLLTSTRETLTLQIKEAQARNEMFGSVLGVVQAAAPSFGAPGLIVGGLAGLAGTIFGVNRNGAAKTAQQKHDDTLAQVEKIIDAIDVAKTANPKMKEAFKESGALLSEWMGSGAKALVSRLQEHSKEAA